MLCAGNGIYYGAQVHENYHRKDAEAVFTRKKFPAMWKTGREDKY